MKTSAFFIVSLLYSLLASAQNLCADNQKLTEKTSFEITAYGTSNTLVAVTNFNVSSTFNTLSGRKAIIAQIDKDAPTQEPQNYYSLECADSTLLINNRNIIPAYVFEEYSNMNFDASASSIAIPKKLDVGQKLSNAAYEIEVEVAPITHRLHYFLTDRIVTAKETINTPAGTFECYLIEAKTHMKPRNNNTGSVKQWFAEDIGLVKQVDYNVEGAITGINLLTDLKF